MDILSPQQRSERMSKIRSKSSKPEMTVRRLVYSMGYRYRLHCKDLPGHPDLTFRKSKKIIFIHGCFWHLHDNCAKARLPKSNLDYWKPKLYKNKENDIQNISLLESEGWKVLVIWECEINSDNLYEKLKNFLEG